MAPVLLPLAVLIGTGLWGLDFGLHWDERVWQIGPVKTMIRTGILLPGYYTYPSFDYWLIGCLTLPDMLIAWMLGPAATERVLSIVDSPAYLLRLRAVFLLISSLGVVWVYLTMLRLRGSTLEAMLAACLLALSWEVAYHLRWVATDGVLMQFGALTLLLSVMACTG